MEHKKKRLLAPLEMNDTVLDHDEMLSRGNYTKATESLTERVSDFSSLSSEKKPIPGEARKEIIDEEKLRTGFASDVQGPAG